MTPRRLTKEEATEMLREYIASPAETTKQEIAEKHGVVKSSLIKYIKEKYHNLDKSEQDKLSKREHQGKIANARRATDIRLQALEYSARHPSSHGVPQVSAGETLARPTEWQRALLEQIERRFDYQFTRNGVSEAAGMQSNDQTVHQYFGQLQKSEWIQYVGDTTHPNRPPNPNYMITKSGKENITRVLASSAAAMTSGTGLSRASNLTSNPVATYGNAAGNRRGHSPTR